MKPSRQTSANADTISKFREKSRNTGSLVWYYSTKRSYTAITSTRFAREFTCAAQENERAPRFVEWNESWSSFASKDPPAALDFAWKRKARLHNKTENSKLRICERACDFYKHRAPSRSILQHDGIAQERGHRFSDIQLSSQHSCAFLIEVPILIHTSGIQWSPLLQPSQTLATSKLLLPSFVATSLRSRHCNICEAAYRQCKARHTRCWCLR